MAPITIRFRSLWILAAGLSLLAGVAAAALEASIHTGRACPRHSGGGLAAAVAFLLLALVPAAVTGLVGRRSRRVAADTVGPFVLALSLSVFLVFIGLAAAWGGHGCMT